jgi:hypothetical protein
VPDSELDMACAIIVLKSVRLFFDTPDTEPYGPGASKLLEKWRQVPADSREGALFEFHRLLWEGLLEALRNSYIKKGAVWHD